jgi:hypothetical protein
MLHENFARQLIPMMQERINSSLGDKEKQEIIKLLVRRALLNRFGDLTIELRVPAPDSFATATSPRAAIPDYKLGLGNVGGLASYWN